MLSIVRAHVSSQEIITLGLGQAVIWFIVS